jgi:hypothetical protein
MDEFAALTGRRYRLAEYSGDPQAERVVVVMGSGAQTVAQTVEHLCARGEQVGMVQLRLYRPFPVDEVLAAIPASCTRLAILDRTKEPGAGGEPLFLDVVSALGEAVGTGRRDRMPLVIGGRYGLSSKEFTPAWSRASTTSSPCPPRAPGSRWASPTTSRACPCPTRRTSTWRTPRPCARSSTGSAPTARSAPTRTPSRSSVAGRHLRAGLLRLRLEEVGLAHRLAPAVRADARSVRPTSSARPVRRVPPVRVHRAGGRAAGRRVPARCCC